MSVKIGGEKLGQAAHHLQTKLPLVRRTSDWDSIRVLLPSFVSFHRRGFIAQIISFFSLSEMTIGWWVESLIRVGLLNRVDMSIEQKITIRVQISKFRIVISQKNS